MSNSHSMLCCIMLSGWLSKCCPIAQDSSQEGSERSAYVLLILSFGINFVWRALLHRIFFSGFRLCSYPLLAYICLACYNYLHLTFTVKFLGTLWLRWFFLVCLLLDVMCGFLWLWILCQFNIASWYIYFFLTSVVFECVLGPGMEELG